MAAIDSPRRILGERDVNKSLSTKQLSITDSPRKPTVSPRHDCLPGDKSGLREPSQELFATKMCRSFPLSASTGSPPGSKKRGAACLEDIQDGPPRKQAIIGLPDITCDENRPTTCHSKTRPLQTSMDDHHVEATNGEAMSGPEALRRSVSLDSSFDATQDSELLDSQITNITEPEDILPRPLTTAPLVTPRVISQQEIRENAEALRLRLKVAMYKVKTNQTDLPFSQLRIQSPTRSLDHSMRTPLPTSRPIPASQYSKNSNKPVQPAASSSSPRAEIKSEDDNLQDHFSVPPSSPPIASMKPAHRHDDHHPVSHSNHDDDNAAAHRTSHNHNSNNCNISSLTTPILPRSSRKKDVHDALQHVHHHYRSRRSNSGSGPEPDPGLLEVTSSVVKGRHAADGLLSLMTGGEGGITRGSLRGS